MGLRVVAYNNPFDTKVDLTPELLAELYHEGTIVGVEEFSGDVRRAYQISELAAGPDLLIAADDVLVELGLAGATGWIAGYPNMVPESTVELYSLAASGDPADLARALPVSEICTRCFAGIRRSSSSSRSSCRWTSRASRAARAVRRACRSPRSWSSGSLPTPRPSS